MEKISYEQWCNENETYRGAGVGGPTVFHQILGQGWTINKYADPTDDAREGLSVEEAAAVSREDPGLLYLTRDESSGNVHCECGKLDGERCAWDGPVSQTVVVEVMPEHLRASHEAAGNRGAYPHNGALRLRVERSCADRMVEHDGEWCSIVG